VWVAVAAVAVRFFLALPPDTAAAAAAASAHASFLTQVSYPPQYPSRWVQVVQLALALDQQTAALAALLPLAPIYTAMGEAVAQAAVGEMGLPEEAEVALLLALPALADQLWQVLVQILTTPMTVVGAATSKVAT
jgi:hypothetical protein